MVLNTYNAKRVFIENTITVTCILAVISGCAFVFLYITGIKILNFDVSIILNKKNVKLTYEKEKSNKPEKNYQTNSEIMLEYKDSVHIIKQDTSKTSNIDSNNITLKDTVIDSVRVITNSNHISTYSLIEDASKLINSADYRSALIQLDRCKYSKKLMPKIEYLRAKAITGLYMSAVTNGSQVIASWKEVKKLYTKDSKQCHEADSILGLFGVME